MKLLTKSHMSRLHVASLFIGTEKWKVVALSTHGHKENLDLLIKDNRCERTWLVVQRLGRKDSGIISFALCSLNAHRLAMRLLPFLLTFVIPFTSSHLVPLGDRSIAGGRPFPWATFTTKHWAPALSFLTCHPPNWYNKQAFALISRRIKCI